MSAASVRSAVAQLPVGESVALTREFFLSLGVPGLFAVAFLEFFLLPVPPDLVLIPLAVTQPKLVPVYAAVATAGSVSAGLVGYAIGWKGGRRALASRFSGGRIECIEAYVDRHGFATVAVGAFAPIPEGYELLSVGAGVFGLGWRSYLVASLFGRGGRYLLEAALAVALGEAARSLSEPELYSVVGAAALVVVLAYVFGNRWLPDRVRGRAE